MSREKRWRLVDVVARAGAPVELVFEEPETTEAITMAAHPGRRAKDESAAEATGAEDSSGAGASASDAEAVADAGASASEAENGSADGAMAFGGEAPQAKRAVAPEPSDAEEPAGGKARK